MIMRLNRSSGVGGLAGIRARNGTVLRPLLSWRRDDLTALALEADLPLVEDPSNSDIRFDRARLRQALRSQTILDPQAAARPAAVLADAAAAIASSVAGAIDSWAYPAEGCLSSDRDSPPQLFPPP